MERSFSIFRLLELLFLFSMLPLALASGLFPRPWVIYLFAAGIPLTIWLRFVRKRPWTDFWTGPESSVRSSDLLHVISRFGINSIALVVLTLGLYPDKLLSFPAAFPIRWLAVMILYPLIMVYPQELVFRMYFAERYAGLLATDRWLIVVNALLFGWVHILYGNMLAVVLSGIGGALFMDTYLRTRSMKLVWLEHVLYGNLVFTIGLGEFFYSGWAG